MVRIYKAVASREKSRRKDKVNKFTSFLNKNKLFSFDVVEAIAALILIGIGIAIILGFCYLLSLIVRLSGIVV